ncbi:MAG TPA: F0F1 ATP synthase subunit delta [Candidatus Saccharimonadales bacterium]|nr:F0F1 ATP synthase subunit delta [Candidatus Saccharimonadales bacterium]
MKVKLDGSVASPQDLKTLILEMRGYAHWFSQNAVKKRLNAKSASEKPDLSVAAESLIRDLNQKKSLDRKGLDELIADLEEFADTAPRLNVTLAAPPVRGLKKTLVNWLREEISPEILVTFDFNSTLLGGMVLRCGSRIFDWSLRRQILDERARFPEVLRNA